VIERIKTGCTHIRVGKQVPGSVEERHGVAALGGPTREEVAKRVEARLFNVGITSEVPGTIE